MNRERLIHKGNDSLAIGAVWGLGAVVQPCPICVLSSAAFVINGIKEKLVD